jgi:aspartokinase
VSLIVQKYGGTSVANAERLFNVANRVVEAYKQGNSMVVVVSAQGDTTDDLIAKACEINANPSKREMDMLLATGEQISMSLLAMTIEKMGYHVTSLTGYQAGINTNGPVTVDIIEPGDYALCRVDPAQVSLLWTGSLPSDRCRKGSLDQDETLTLSSR